MYHKDECCQQPNEEHHRSRFFHAIHAMMNCRPGRGFRNHGFYPPVFMCCSEDEQSQGKHFHEGHGEDCCDPHSSKGSHMCHPHGDMAQCHSELPVKWVKLGLILKALRVPTRWKIVEFIGEEEKRTEEIFASLNEDEGKVTKSALYYHLAELKGADIIELAGYREEGGGAPEKIWKLKTRKIEIDLLED